MRYCFNGFEIDTLQFKLFYAGNTLALEPKVFDLLIYLLKNRHRPVTRDELFDSVWEGQVVGDTTLSNHINSARKILGDNGNDQTVIATLRGRGYQFIAETQEVVSPKSSISSSTSTWHKGRFYLIISVFSLLLTGFLLTHFLKSESGSNKTLSIAVLPFDNAKQNPETDYLGFAIADQIIGNIAYLEQITVRASASVRKYEMLTIDPIKVGEELNVNFILTGNYLQLTEFIRLNIELIEVGSNNLLWRETIQSKSGDSFKLNTQIVNIIAQKLNLQLTSSDKKRMQKDIPASAQAYDFYLRAISYPITVDGAKLAIPMLKKSLELDENFAPTFVELAYRYNYLAVFSLRMNSAKDKAIEYYKVAISLNPESRNALSGLADIYTETGKTGEAVELLRKLISLNPSDAQAHFSLGYSYRYAGMTLEAIAEMELALAIDPYNPKFRSITLSYDAAGLNEEALNAKYAFEESPASLGFKVIALINMGKMAEALVFAEEIITLEPSGLWHTEAMIQKAIITGDHKAGLHGLRKFEAAEVHDAEAYFYWARYYMALGDEQGCIRLLRKAINNGYFNYPYISTASFFESVRDESGFQELLAIAKKKHLDFKQKYF